MSPDASIDPDIEPVRKDAIIMEMSARAAFWLAIGFALYMALTPHPPQLVANDKLQHMLAFAALAAAAAVGYRHGDLLRIGERLSFLGALIEVLQAMPALHRDCDIRDWLADTASLSAVLLAVAAVRLLRLPAVRATDWRLAAIGAFFALSLGVAWIVYAKLI